MTDEIYNTGDLTTTTVMTVTPPAPEKRVRLPIPASTLNARFFCSHCGTLQHRTVKWADRDAGHPIAFYCNPRCEQMSRLEGFRHISDNVRAEIATLSEGPLSIREIAKVLRLSPAGLEAFMRDSYQGDAKPLPVKSGIPNIGKPRGSHKKRKEEDDIFAPLHGMMIG